MSMMIHIRSFAALILVYFIPAETAFIGAHLPTKSNLLTSAKVSHNTCCRRVPCRGGARQLRGSGGSGEEWMFASVRGDETNRNLFELGLLAPPVGQMLVVGKKYELQLSKTSDELLVKNALAEGKEIAYGVGLASTSGTFANAQNFVAGAAVSRLRVLALREDESGRAEGACCSVAVMGRALIKEVKHMRPHFVVSALEHEDARLRDELLDPTYKLRLEIEEKHSACVELQRKISEKRVQARLSNLEKGSFLLNIPDDQLVELTKASKEESSEQSTPEPATTDGGPGTTFDSALPLSEQLESALSWLGPAEPTRELEVFSFLALSAAGAGRSALEEAMRGRDVRERLCGAIELLDTELARLRAEAALADFGGF